MRKVGRQKAHLILQGITALAFGKAHREARLEPRGTAKRLFERAALIRGGPGSRTFGGQPAFLEALSFAMLRRSGFRIGGARASAPRGSRGLRPGSQKSRPNLGHVLV